tara:strand:- start:364 stop:603 length:240 start_codon:yes stop_codon:yes gene_type:complete
MEFNESIFHKLIISVDGNDMCMEIDRSRYRPDEMDIIFDGTTRVAINSIDKDSCLQLGKALIAVASLEYKEKEEAKEVA